jgi:hypothetical protein
LTGPRFFILGWEKERPHIAETRMGGNSHPQLEGGSTPARKVETGVAEFGFQSRNSVYLPTSRTAEL